MFSPWESCTRVCVWLKDGVCIHWLSSVLSCFEGAVVSVVFHGWQIKWTVEGVVEKDAACVLWMRLCLFKWKEVMSPPNPTGKSSLSWSMCFWFLIDPHWWIILGDQQTSYAVKLGLAWPVRKYFPTGNTWTGVYYSKWNTASYNCMWFHINLECVSYFYLLCQFQFNLHLSCRVMSGVKWLNKEMQH